MVCLYNTRNSAEIFQYLLLQAIENMKKETQDEFAKVKKKKNEVCSIFPWKYPLFNFKI